MTPEALQNAWNERDPFYNSSNKGIGGVVPMDIEPKRQGRFLTGLYTAFAGAGKPHDDTLNRYEKKRKHSHIQLTLLCLSHYPIYPL